MNLIVQIVLYCLERKIIFKNIKYVKDKKKFKSQNSVGAYLD